MLGLTELSLYGAVPLLLDPSQLEQDQIVLGNLFDMANATNSLVTLLKAVVRPPQLSSLLVRCEDVTLSLDNFTNGLKELVTSVWAMFDGALKLLRRNLPSFSQRLIRPWLNNVMAAWYNAHYEDEVPKYMPSESRQWLDLEHSLAAKFSFFLLNEVIGGGVGMDARSALNINTIVDDQLYAFRSELAALLGPEQAPVAIERVAGIERGAWQLTSGKLGDSFNSPLRRISTFDGGSWLAVGGVQLRNLDSVYALHGDALGPQRLRLDVSAGGPKEERLLNVSAWVRGLVCSEGDRGQADCPPAATLFGADDSFLLGLNLNLDVSASLQLDFDYSRLMTLHVQDVREWGCQVLLVNRLSLEALRVQTESLFVSLIPERGEWSGRRRIGKALRAMQLELASGASKSVTTWQARYVIKHGVDRALKLAGEIAALNRDLPVDNCRDNSVRLPEGSLTIPSEDAVDQGWFADMPDIRTWREANPATNQAKQPAWRWENRPGLGLSDRPLDIRGSYLVDLLTSTFNNSGLDRVRELAGIKYVSNFLKVRPDNVTVDLDVDLRGWWQVGADGPGSEAEAGFSLSLSRLVVRNVSGTRFHLFQPYPDARFTMEHTVQTARRLEVTVAVQVRAPGEFVGSPAREVSEELELSFAVEGLRATAITFLALDLDAFELLQLGDLLDFDVATQEFALRQDDLLACLGRAVFPRGLGLPGFQVAYAAISDVALTTRSESGPPQLLSPAGAELAGALAEVALAVVKDEARDVTQGPLRLWLDEAAQEMVLGSRAVCPERSALLAQELGENDPERFYNLRASTQLPQLYAWIDAALKPDTKGFVLNDWLAALLPAPDLSGPLSQIQLPLTWNGASLGAVQLGLGRLAVSGLATVDVLQLADVRNMTSYDRRPGSDTDMTDFTARSGLRLANGPTQELAVEFDLRLRAEGLFEGRPGRDAEDAVQDDLRVRVALSVLELSADLVTQLDLLKLMRLRVASLLTLSQLPCLLDLFPPGGLDVRALNVDVGDITLQLRCVGTCNSPLLASLQDGEEERNEELDQLVTKATATALELLQRWVNSSDLAATIDQQVAAAGPACQAIWGEPLDPIVVRTAHVAKYFALVGIVALLACAVALACLIPLHMRREHEAVRVAHAEVYNDVQRRLQLAALSQGLLPLARHPAMPRRWRALLPFFVLVNVAVRLRQLLRAGRGGAHQARAARGQDQAGRAALFFARVLHRRHVERGHLHAGDRHRARLGRLALHQEPRAALRVVRARHAANLAAPRAHARAPRHARQVVAHRRLRAHSHGRRLPLLRLVQRHRPGQRLPAARLSHSRRRRQAGIRHLRLPARDHRLAAGQPRHALLGQIRGRVQPPLRAARRRQGRGRRGRRGRTDADADAAPARGTAPAPLRAAQARAQPAVRLRARRQDAPAHVHAAHRRPHRRRHLRGAHHVPLQGHRRGCAGAHRREAHLGDILARRHRRRRRARQRTRRRHTARHRLLAAHARDVRHPCAARAARAARRALAQAARAAQTAAAALPRRDRVGMGSAACFRRQHHRRRAAAQRARAGHRHQHDRQHLRQHTVLARKDGVQGGAVLRRRGDAARIKHAHARGRGPHPICAHGCVQAHRGGSSRQGRRRARTRHRTLQPLSCSAAIHSDAPSAYQGRTRPDGRAHCAHQGRAHARRRTQPHLPSTCGGVGSQSKPILL